MRNMCDEIYALGQSIENSLKMTLQMDKLELHAF